MPKPENWFENTRKAMEHPEYADAIQVQMERNIAAKEEERKKLREEAIEAEAGRSRFNPTPFSRPHTLIQSDFIKDLERTRDEKEGERFLGQFGPDADKRN